jgi:hypothetical protein
MSPDRRTIDNVVDRVKRAGPNAMKLGAAVLPILRRQDFNKDVDYILKNDPIVAEYIRNSPSSKQKLYDVAKTVYTTQARPYIIGGELIDSYDVLSSAAGLGMDLFGPETGGLGTAASGLEDVIELVPKALYAGAYARGMNDYSALVPFAISEAASFIPVVGDLIDMKHLYADRARKRFREIVAERFLADVSKGKSSIQH